MKEITIERLQGRISAFTEIKELLSFVNTSDKYTADQLKILTEHIEKQIEIDTHTIDIDLQLMEGYELLGR